MPKINPTDPLLLALLAFQDDVLHREQALTHGRTPRVITHRLQTADWQRLLPRVYLTQSGEPSRRQLMIAAQLYAGPESAIDGVDACRFHGLKYVAIDERIHVVVPWGSSVRSRGFVIVRRTNAQIVVVCTDRLRYVDAASAVIAATRLMTSERSVLATLSDALQRNVTTYEELVAAHYQGARRNAKLAEAALEHLGAGTRSAPEADFRRLVAASDELPEVTYNVWLLLPNGRRLCVDALIESSAVIHETNGRLAHQREDLFEDLQERHDELTAAGFTVLHNPPSRLRLRGPEVLAQVEQCHLRYAGRGLPAGVGLLGSEAK